jgi:hypothetical protein
MFNWFKKENWRLVKTFTNDIEQTLTKRDGKLYYHLFESDKGKRRIEFACTISIDHASLEEDAKRIPIYQEKLFRWVNGRIDPDIPHYDQVPEEETANALRGKIE